MTIPLVQIAPEPVLQFTDSSGNLLAGGLLFTYAAGTNTKLATYTDSTGATPNTNPIVLNARGECSVWCTPGLSYKFVLSPSTDTDPPQNQFWTSDNLTPGSYLYEVIAQSTTSLTIGTGGQTFSVAPYTNFQTGQNVTIVNSAGVTNWMYGTITGYVPASGALTVNVVSVGGSGTAATWNVSLGGSPAIMAATAQYAAAASGAATTIANNITAINTLANDITAINAINTAQIAALNNTQIAALSTTTILAALSANAANMGSIQNAAANALSAAASATQAAAYTATCLAALNSAQAGSLVSSQLNGVIGSGLVGLTTTQIIGLMPAMIAAIKTNAPAQPINNSQQFQN